MRRGPRVTEVANQPPSCRECVGCDCDELDVFEGEKPNGAGSWRARLAVGSLMVHDSLKGEQFDVAAAPAAACEGVIGTLRGEPNWMVPNLFSGMSMRRLIQRGRGGELSSPLASEGGSFSGEAFP